MTYKEYMEVKNDICSAIEKELIAMADKANDKKMLGENTSYYCAGLVSAQSIVNSLKASEVACIEPQIN